MTTSPKATGPASSPRKLLSMDFLANQSHTGKEKMGPTGFQENLYMTEDSNGKMAQRLALMPYWI